MNFVDIVVEPLDEDTYKINVLLKEDMDGTASSVVDHVVSDDAVRFSPFFFFFFSF